MTAGLVSGRLGLWTRYFTVASAIALVGTEVLVVFGGGRLLVAMVALFGYVCPMIFGMAYLLLPSFVGRTLVDYRLPGIHFCLAYGGATGLIIGRVIGSIPLIRAGVTFWCLGVVFFVGILVWTVAPALGEWGVGVIHAPDRTVRSTRIEHVMLAVALGYLIVGTGRLVDWAVHTPLSDTVLPAVAHYYGAGLGVLLIVALGVRLMPGIFHVTPPRVGIWLILLPGAVGPGLLATALWGGVLFRVGAVLQAVTMLGYAGVVGYVFWRSEWHRPGRYGILLGAVGGVVGVGINVPVAFGIAVPGQLLAHTTTVISGFFALTIIGYAIQFFAIPSGQFRGATTNGVIGTMVALAIGTVLRAGGLLVQIPALVRGGAVLTLGGATAYAYLIGRRLLGD